MVKFCAVTVLIAGLLFLGSRVAVTQPQPDLKAMQAEIEKLKKNQEQIQKQLESITNFLRGRQAPDAFKPVVLNIGDDPFKGEITAGLTLVDFSDYQ
ncbi:MAG TPA: hypothetical protein VGB25_02535 [Candidatus Binatia bacterium]